MTTSARCSAVTMESSEIAGKYDRIAEAFHRSRSDQGLDYLKRALSYAPPRGSAFDAGCGTGVPLTAHLVSTGFRTTGIDVSGGMLSIAKKAVPGAEFLVSDMQTFGPDHLYDVVVAWDSLFHVPYSSQKGALLNLLKLVAPGGVILFTVGGIDSEITGTMHGQEFYYSSLSEATYRSIIESAAMTCVLAEKDQSPENHVVFIAQRE